MRTRLTSAVALAALLSFAASARAAPAPGGIGEPGTVPAARLPFFQRGPNGIDLDGLPGVTGPAVPGHPGPGPDGALDPASKRGPSEAQAAPPAKPPTRAEALDRLFDRLSRSKDEDEAKGIAGLVQRMWMESGSDTADLLMERALTAMNGDRHDVAAALFDKIIELRPGWAEAWNKRATLRFLDGDDSGSMEDISHVLSIEPRHFGALSGMGFILARHGEDAAALTALRRALSVYPENADTRKAADKLVPAVEGRDL